MHARHTLERERVGRDLHDDVGTSGVRHAAEKLLQIVALGGGELGVEELLSDHVAVRADQADLRAELCLEHVLDQIARARFAAGAGDAYERRFARRLAEKIAAHERKAEAAVADLHIGRAVRGDLFAEDDGRSFFHRRGDKAVSVGGEALDGDEEVSRLGLARVVAHAGDLRIQIRRGGQDLNISQDLG